MTSHYDCGDGVPHLPATKSSQAKRIPAKSSQASRPQSPYRSNDRSLRRSDSDVLSAGLRPIPSSSERAGKAGRSRVRGLSVSFAVIGQLVVGAMIAASGDLLLGAVSSAAVFSCCLALVASEAMSSGESEATTVSREYTTNSDDETGELEIVDSVV